MAGSDEPKVSVEAAAEKAKASLEEHADEAKASFEEHAEDAKERVDEKDDRLEMAARKVDALRDHNNEQRREPSRWESS